MSGACISAEIAWGQGLQPILPNIQSSLVQALQLQLLAYGHKCIFKFLLIRNQFQVNGAELMVVFPSEESQAATH